MRTILFSLLAFTVSAHASGSITLEDLERVMKSNDTLEPIFRETLQLADSGEASRLGRHYGELSGARVGDYSFRAAFKSETHGEAFPLMVTLKTEWHIADIEGNVYGTEPAPAGVKGLSIVEMLTGIEIVPAVSNPNSTTDEKSNQPKPAQPAQPAQPAPAPSPVASADSFTASLAEGDRLYAGEYFSDEYHIIMKAGQSIDITFQGDDFTPVILTKKDGKYSLSAGRYDGKTKGETATLSWTSTADSQFITTFTTKSKGASGSYQASIMLDGKALIPSTTATTSKPIKLN